jgi:precorrin-6Y C5,15-methyltransferase (decarboxylating)
VVINAISLETLSEIKEILKLPYVSNPDVVLAQFSHAKNVMDYNLMTSDNPVWICSFDFKSIGY